VNFYCCCNIAAAIAIDAANLTGHLFLLYTADANMTDAANLTENLMLH